jgi:hypothetical protein
VSAEPLTTPKAKLGRSWPAYPFVAAVVLGVLAGLTAPSVPAKETLPDWFVPFFSASAGVIATLFVALSLGTRQIQVTVWMAWLTVFYVGVGEVAAVAGLCAALPHGIYPILIGATVGAGIGALLSSMMIGALAIAADEAARRQRSKQTLRERKKPGAPAAPPPTS